MPYFPIYGLYLMVAGQTSDLLAQLEAPEADTTLHTRFQQPAALPNPHQGQGCQNSLRDRLRLQH